MKIIGESRDTLIAEISREEAARFMGYYFEGAGAPKLKTGDVIQLSKCYQQMQNIHDADREVRMARHHLENLLKALEEVPPLIPAVEKPEGDPACHPA